MHLDPWIRRTFIDPNYKSRFDLEKDYDIIDALFYGRKDELINEL